MFAVVSASDRAAHAYAPNLNNESFPAVASDPVSGVSFVVAAADDGRIYGVPVGPGGEVTRAPLALSSPRTPSSAPAVAWVDGEFVVVWQASVLGCGQDVRGARVSARGAIIKANIVYSPCAGDQTAPQVVDGSSSSVVVWANAAGGIQGVPFSPLGNGAVVDISPTGSDPAVAWNGSEYLAVWTNGGDIFGRRLTSVGALAGSAFTLSATANTQFEPAVASNGVGWLTTWTELTATYDVNAMLVDASGTPSGSTISVAAAIRDQGGSAAAFDGTNYFVVWNDSRNDPTGATYDINGARIDPATGHVVDAIPQDVGQYAGQQIRPAVAWTGSRHFTVWEDGRNGQSDVYGARVTAAGVREEAAHFPVFVTKKTAVSFVVSISNSIRANGRESATVGVFGSSALGPIAHATVKLSVGAWNSVTPGTAVLGTKTLTLDGNGYGETTVTSTRAGSALITATINSTIYTGSHFVQLNARRRSVVVFVGGAGSYITCSTNPCSPAVIDLYAPIRDVLDDAGNDFTAADMPNFSYAGGVMDAVSHEWRPNGSTCQQSAQPYKTSITNLRNMLRMFAADNPNTDFTVVGISQGGLLAFQMLGAQTTPLPKGSRLVRVITLDAPLGGIPVENGDNLRVTQPLTFDCFFQNGQSPAALTMQSLWATTSPSHVAAGDNATVMCKLAGFASCGVLTTNAQLVTSRSNVDVITWGSTTDEVFKASACPNPVPGTADAISTQVVSTATNQLRVEPYVVPNPDTDNLCVLLSHISVAANRANDIAAAIGPQQ